VIAWKGKFGWILPDIPVRHRAAQKGGGKIYLPQEEVEQEIEVGGHVSFFLYADERGLCASHVIPAKESRRVIPARGGKASSVPSGRAAQPSGKGRQPMLPVKLRRELPAKAKAMPRSARDKVVKTEDKDVKKEVEPPDLSSRIVLSTEALEGIVLKWNGEVGFVKPNEPITDEESGKTKDRLYLHKSDLEGDQEPLVGAEVLFFSYKDAKGMGAEQCSILVQGSGTLPESVGEAFRKREPGRRARKKPQLKMQKFALKAASKHRERRRGRGGARHGGEKEKGPSGPDLEREVVLDNIVGKVIGWSGKFGWIKPEDPLDIPEAKKHSGRIYVHKQDLIGEEKLERGATVQFTVFKDASGLGAQEVVLN
jgi:cold shock CspA family protein